MVRPDFGWIFWKSRYAKVNALTNKVNELFKAVYYLCINSNS